MTFPDQFPPQEPELHDNPHIISEYRMYRERLHVQEGMSLEQAKKVVEHQAIHDPEFIVRAKILEAYISKILEPPYGLSPDIFNKFITDNPKRVLEDAKDWGDIRRQNEQAFTPEFEPHETL
jgi:hypothetical protein